jgi:arginyl-tRNA synthetase
MVICMRKAIQTLEDNGYLYEKEGAKWFRSTDFGDEKDRVVVSGALTITVTLHA